MRRGGEGVAPLAAVVPLSLEAAPDAHPLHLFGAAARARTAWGGRGGVGEAEMDEEDEEENAPGLWGTPSTLRTGNTRALGRRALQRCRHPNKRQVAHAVVSDARGALA